MQVMADRMVDKELAQKMLRELEYLMSTGIPNLSPLLPYMLSLKGKPYTLERHFPLEPFFNTNMPRKILLKAGRQIGKSTVLAAQGIVSAATIPFFNILYITPLFEMIRRFSHNYVRSFIEQSHIKHMLVRNENSQNVLQRQFVNNSSLYFSFCFTDAERTRGVPASKVGVDEIQDIDSTFLPVIRETLSGSEDWGLESFAGTPKSLDNTIEQLWQKSSGGEWCIPCSNCKYLNVPRESHDLVDMLGPWRDDISDEKPGTICAKCGHIIDARNGFWVHEYPERVAEFAGYHLPQCIFPLHYASSDKWKILKGKQEGAYNTQVNTFFNEVLGESYDTGSRLLTQTEIQAAACLHPNDEDIAMQTIGQYDLRVLGVDWGGSSEGGDSYTVYMVVCRRSDGSGIDVIYGFRSLTPNDHQREARIAIDIVKKFRCHYIAHDYGGAGQFREKYIVDAGWPVERLIPIVYVRSSVQGMFRFLPATDIHPRNRYSLDKTRSLVLMCHGIKNKLIKTFAWNLEEEAASGQQSILGDLLALVEEKTDSRTGSDMYTIIRKQNQSDDACHALNYGCCCIWHIRNEWPNVADMDKYTPSEEFLKAAEPEIGARDWDDA
jgi:hypothetical protein